jgi:hypothetical protein
MACSLWGVQGIREQLKHPPATLQLRPDEFVQYLTQTVGFTLLRQLLTPSGARGFDRPLYLLQKVG